MNCFKALLTVLADGLHEVALERERVRNAKLHAREKYRGTRVVEVALKIYEDRGRLSKTPFWSLGENDRNRFLQDAERSLRTNPHCWGRLYKWRRRLQKSLHPIASLLAYINNNFDMSFERHARLYRWSHGLEWQTGNWNIVVLRTPSLRTNS